MPCLPLRLEAPGLETLDLTDGQLGLVRVDLGDALTREVSELAPDSDGSIDTTSLIGPRVVTMEVLVDLGTLTRWRATQMLRSFTHPRLRPKLYVQYSAGDPELMLTLRRSQFTDSFGPGDAGRGRVVIQWVAPLGIIESAELQLAVSTASGAAGALGRTYDLEFNRIYPATDPEGSVLITNDGDADAFPLIRLYGPFSGEVSIINDLTGRAIVLDGETVAAGNYLEIDTRARTILLNSDPDQSRYQRLVFAETQWWTLVPGEQRVRFVAESFTSPAQAQTWWRSSWL